MIDTCSISPQIISGGVIAVIGVVVGYLSARRIANINAVNAAFYDELAALFEWNNNDINIPALLEKAFPKHLSAVLEFANFLSIDDRDRFISQWKKYYQDENNSGDSMYYHDFSKYSVAGDKKNKANRANRELAIQRLEDILSYAKA